MQEKTGLCYVRAAYNTIEQKGKVGRCQESVWVATEAAPKGRNREEFCCTIEGLETGVWAMLFPQQLNGRDSLTFASEVNRAFSGYFGVLSVCTNRQR